MYVGKQKYFNHDLSSVDIPFIEMILHYKQFPQIYRFLFYKITDIFSSECADSTLLHLHKIQITHPMTLLMPSKFNPSVMCTHVGLYSN